MEGGVKEYGELGEVSTDQSYRADGPGKFGFCSKYKEKLLGKEVLNRTVTIQFSFLKILRLWCR